MVRMTLPVDLRCSRKSKASLIWSRGKWAEMCGEMRCSSYSSITSSPICLVTRSYASQIIRQQIENQSSSYITTPSPGGSGRKRTSCIG